jgi:hypothetical protein
MIETSIHNVTEIQVGDSIQYFIKDDQRSFFTRKIVFKSEFGDIMIKAFSDDKALLELNEKEV